MTWSARVPWINGVKTGHTLDAGYVLVASGTQRRHDADRRRARHLERGRARLERAGAAQLGIRELRHAHAGARRARCWRGRVGHRQARHARAAGRGLDVHARVPALGEGQAPRARAARSSPGPLPAHAVVGSVAVVDGRPGRDADPAAARPARCRRSSTPRSIASAVVVSVTLSGLLVAAGAAVGLTMFWREWTSGTGAAGLRSRDDHHRHPQRRARQDARGAELQGRPPAPVGRADHDAGRQGRQHRPRAEAPRPAGDRDRARRRRDRKPDRRRAQRRGDPQRVRADPRGVADQHRGARPHDRPAHRDQRARARPSPPTTSSCSATSCCTWPRARACACSPAACRAASRPTCTRA